MIAAMKHSVILLCGMPRSGTTWIGKIFDSHPDTLYRHEPDSGKALRSVPLVAPIVDTEKYRDILRDFIEHLPLLNTPRAAGSLPLFPKRYHSSAHLFMRHLAVLAAKASEVFHRDLPVIDLIDYEKVSNLRIVWKSIESSGRIGIILRAVPDCRAIVILRHPCGYIASVLNGEENHRFSAPTASGDDFPIFDMLLRCSPHKERNPALSDLKAMSMVERLAWRWLLYNEIALADSVESEHCSAVRYEDLCSNPLAKARELLDFAGLDWHPQVETFIHRTTTRSSGRYYSVYKDPQDAAIKWQRQLNPASIDLVMKVVGQSDLADIYSAVGGPKRRGARQNLSQTERVSSDRVSHPPAIN
jgi:hypothetical protein